VTLSGVWLIKETIAEAERQGMVCIYGDTDSAFITGVSKERFEAFVEHCNKVLYPAMITGRGCTRNAVKLAYEKEFARLVMTTAKKYVGNYTHYKGKLATADSKPEVRGLEYKRGDASRLARELQAEAIELLMRKCCDDPAAYHALVVRYRDNILHGLFTLQDVQISKRLSQSLSRYAVRLKKDGTASAQQPHVMIGKILAKRGRDVGEGQKIDYVCVDGSTSPKQYIPAEDFDGTFDRHEMWESLVYPPTQRLLEAAFPKAGWEAYERTRPAKTRARKDNLTLDLFEHAASQPKKL
jgi:DNA polymerase elongation subunit (family B)